MKLPRALPLQSVLFFFLPLTIGLVVLIGWSITSHQNEMREMIGERNEQTTLYLVQLLKAQQAALLASNTPEADVESLLREVNLLTSQRTIIIVDHQQKAIFTWGDHHAQSLLPQHPGVAEAIKGKQGTIEEEFSTGLHLISYAWISELGWGVVVEETWLDHVSATLNMSLFTPLLLVPVVFVTFFYLWATDRWIARPLRQIHQFAQKIGRGQLEQTLPQLYGIREIEELGIELRNMTHQLATAQQVMQSYASAIQVGQEEERYRLAQELHDDTVQALVYLDQQAQLALGALHKDDDSAEKWLHALRDQVSSTSRNLRRLIQNLRPTYLDELGLVPALEALVSQLSQASDLPIQLEIMGQKTRLPNDVEVALYRITQEALNNAIQHAQATHLCVRLIFGKQIKLCIEDNGQGFSFEEQNAQKRFGLIGMGERAKKIRAEMHIESFQNAGTKIVTTLPFQHGASQSKSSP